MKGSSNYRVSHDSLSGEVKVKTGDGNIQGNSAQSTSSSAELNAQIPQQPQTHKKRTVEIVRVFNGAKTMERGFKGEVPYKDMLLLCEDNVPVLVGNPPIKVMFQKGEMILYSTRGIIGSNGQIITF